MSCGRWDALRDLKPALLGETKEALYDQRELAEALTRETGWTIVSAELTPTNKVKFRLTRTGGG